ncbi:MAG: ABC transporter permease [Bryobacterales bacterium]|nr:ABC transporter permease [Bryobacterales bacterium]
MPIAEDYPTKISAWLESLGADAVFSWRQLNKRRVTSAAAILSLGLAIGACTSAFRIIDALFLRPLPIANPSGLYGLSPAGVARNFTYREFRQMRAALHDDPSKDHGELIAVSGAPSLDVAYSSDQEFEKAHGQFVSGWMFSDFHIQPALGRLLTVNDDLKPGAHPVAVLSYDYWTRRFARDPNVIGRTVRFGPDWRIGPTGKGFEIIGVAPERFAGTETGVMIDIFLPTMMQAMIEVPVASIFRIFVHLPPGAAIEPVRDRLLAGLRSAGPDPSKAPRALVVESALAGASNLRSNYRQAIAALAILVALVLLIACANVANLTTAQAAARSREMALRVAIGAGRSRLVQLVLVECAILTLLASAAGGLLTVWSGPFVVSRINPPGDPVHLVLTTDWRVVVFSLLLILAVTVLFGLVPALRASRLQPFGALTSGTSPRRVMHTLIASQVAFCFLVLFVAGLLVTTFERLSNQPTGISAARVLNLNIVTAHPNAPPVLWSQVAEHLRQVPGVESVASTDWPALDGNGFKTSGVSINGAPPIDAIGWFVNISPGWIGTMRIPLFAGRDFLPADPPGAVIVNEEFARVFFGGENPVGKSFTGTLGAMNGRRFEIVGLVRNAGYRFLRDPMLPVAYTNIQDGNGTMPGGTFVVRTIAANPLALASTLRREVSRVNPEFRVSSLQSQQALIDAQTTRERLLSMLALFFAAVALLLAAIGLYGVLDYSVFQRRREIGIRMAIGARSPDIIRRVTFEILVWLLAGSLGGLALGAVFSRYIATLLYEVKATDVSSLAAPVLALIITAIVAALPPVVRAVRIDPAKVLRSE